MFFFCRTSISGAFSKGPQSKRFRKPHGKHSKQASKEDQTKYKGKKKAGPFKRKPEPVWKKKRTGEDYKISNAKKTNTSTESTPKQGTMQDKGAKLFRRHKPLAGMRHAWKVISVLCSTMICVCIYRSTVLDSTPLVHGLM